MPLTRDNELVSDRLRSIAHLTTALAPSPVLRYQRHGRYERQDGMALIAYDLPGPGFNVAVALGPTPPPDEVLRRAAAFFAHCTDGWGLTVEADAGHPVEAEIVRRGWAVIEEEPVLVLPAIPAPPPAPPHLTVQHVTDESMLADYRATADAGFAAGEPVADAPPPVGNEPSIAEALIPSLACALDPDIALFVGYHNGTPVATAAMHRIENAAEIAGVATLPAHRRRGFATAVAWAAIAEAAARGCTAAALRASAMGYPVYLRMGFVPVLRYRTYAAPAAEAFHA